MASLPSPPVVMRGVSLNRHACSLCARRKVKCDKGDPCSNCTKAQAQCSYEAPAPYRPRKRAIDDELLNRIALYENLLRKHNVDFTSYANIWVSSTPVPQPKEAISSSPTPILSAASDPKHDTLVRVEDIASDLERCPWSDLAPELRYPPIQSLRHRDDPLLCPTSTLQAVCLPGQPELHTLHPEPRHIYRLWQVFVESVNPLTKIIHVPTLQPRVLDASWDPTNIPKPLTAILFAIYTLAVTSLSSSACQATFGEAREALLTRYRTATLRALVANDFLTTKDMEVLQAFTLFLFADPESELASTLTGAAIRLGLKMGLHREAGDAAVPCFFAKEMRIRLWWQLRGLDARVRAVSTPGMHPTPYEFGDVRAPLNLNDADLHPDMTEAPPAHDAPTEMMAVLMKFEVTNWLRTSPSTARIFQDIILGAKKDPAEMQREEDRAIDELERIYRDKYLARGDPRVPLHALTHAMARLAVARMRFRVHHPRGRAAAANGGEVRMTRDEADMVFDAAVTTLEMVDVGMRSRFSSHLFTHLTSRFQMDAYIYVINDLRKRCSGERVALAWRLVEDLYGEHPELIEDGENTFFVALGDLTLEAWEARKKGLVGVQGAREADVTPRFIQLLCEKRHGEQDGCVQAALQNPHSLDVLGLTEYADLDWEYWNDFLRL